MIQGLSSINSVFRKVIENLTIGKPDIGIFCERAQLERFQVVRSLELRLGLDRLSLSSLILFSGEIEGPGAIFIERDGLPEGNYWLFEIILAICCPQAKL